MKSSYRTRNGSDRTRLVRKSTNQRSVARRQGALARLEAKLAAGEELTDKQKKEIVILKSRI